MNKREFEQYFHDSPAKKQMRGDRWLATWLVIGAVFWLVMWLVLR